MIESIARFLELFAVLGLSNVANMLIGVIISILLALAFKSTQHNTIRFMDVLLTCIWVGIYASRYECIIGLSTFGGTLIMAFIVAAVNYAIFRDSQTQLVKALSDNNSEADYSEIKKSSFSKLYATAYSPLLFLLVLYLLPYAPASLYDAFGWVYEVFNKYLVLKYGAALLGSFILFNTFISFIILCAGVTKYCIRMLVPKMIQGNQNRSNKQ